ncbi:MAG: hypothetical protein H7Z10_03625, partial [Gemmatimonadaceae bacterium]|nr:hypothetical protein [Acetobacteraceae bacterium]
RFAPARTGAPFSEQDRTADDRRDWAEEAPAYAPPPIRREPVGQPLPPGRAPWLNEAPSDRQSIGTIVVGPDGSRIFRVRP